MFQAGDLTQLATVKEWLGLVGLEIAAITNANPAVLTLKAAPQVPLLTGQSYTIGGVTGMAGVAGEYVITVIDPKTFSIPVDTTANGTYTGGGYLAIADPLVERLIHACSAYAQTKMSRTIANATYTETRDGRGTTAMTMRVQPITAVHSVTVDGVALPARPSLSSQTVTTVGFANAFGFGCGPFGWVNDDTRVMLSGGARFSPGYQNVTVNYDGGFLFSEVQTIPAVAPYTLTTLGHWSAADRGVVYAASGVALTVADPPGAGQYSVDGSTYTFNAADAGVAVMLSYAYVPFDLEQAIVDMIGDWFRYTARIGKISESIEQQSITFVNVPIPARAAAVIANYNTVMPV